jgi:5'-3' exonuclease
MYKYIIFDGSYFLMRAYHAIHSSEDNYKEIPLVDHEGNIMYSNEDGSMEITYSYTFTHMTILRMMYWQIAKVMRDVAECRKPIIVLDKSPYHKVKELSDYKSNRHYYSEADLDGLTYEDNPRQWVETNEEIRSENIKLQAKEWMKNNFNELGMPVIWHQGYEGDDLAYLLSQQLELDGEKSAICSIDGDWSYLINPNIDHIKMYMRKSPEIITYEDMQDRLRLDAPEGMSLYRYKSLLDSLYGSHNFLKYVANKNEVDYFGDNKTIFTSIENNETKYIEDVDLFQRQLRSFDVERYPEINEVKAKLKTINDTLAPLDVEQYRMFCQVTGFNVTEGYYEKTVANFDHSLYTNEGRIYIS